jgi:hypothetical protein
LRDGLIEIGAGAQLARLRRDERRLALEHEEDGAQATM